MDFPLSGTITVGASSFVNGKARFLYTEASAALEPIPIGYLGEWHHIRTGSQNLSFLLLFCSTVDCIYTNDGGEKSALTQIHCQHHSGKGLYF